MKNFRLALRLALAAVACASIAACADRPLRQSDLDYRSQSSPAMQGTKNTPRSSGQRLTIESGEGERLNLPWFIRDTQAWINRR
ncbi:hypothetical protein [Pusillimonas sp.]|uniref:hypothetical protein n=1 Tax=Pusillimonas sp. TaxID=3040095 RepID=UPI0029BE687C|nr:hypothetical protein [Pusillimonas sp.]MDX3894342.1 hypothetical protein [Pusillimonas sp.]